MEIGLTEAFTRCLDLLYESAIDRAYWTAALRAINELVGGSGALYLVFSADDAIQRADIADIPMEALQLYNVLYSQDRRRAELRKLATLEVFNDETLPDRRSFERTDVFNLVLKPYDLPNHVLTSIPQLDGAYGALVVQRPVCLGPAGRREEKLMRLLGPHVDRALRMQRLLGEHRSRAMLMEDVLERLPHAIALLKSDGNVVRMSSSLRTLLAARRGLYYAQGKLKAKRAQDETAMERAFGLATHSLPSARTSTTFTIAEAPPSTGLVVSVYPLPLRADCPEEAKCLLIVRDPSSVILALVDRLMQAYALTKAEARLAEVMMGGASLQDAADRLRVTVNTCKTQLQAVYRKTNCRNRMELARMILALT